MYSDDLNGQWSSSLMSDRFVPQKPAEQLSQSQNLLVSWSNTEGLLQFNLQAHKMKPLQ